MSFTHTLDREQEAQQGKVRNVPALTALVGTLLVFASLMAWQSDHQQQSVASTQTRSILRASDEVKIAILDAQRQEHDALLTGDPAYLSRYIKDHDDLARSLDHLSMALQGTEHIADAVHELRIAATNYLKAMAKVVALARGGEQARAITTLRRASVDGGQAALAKNVDRIVETARGHARSRAPHSRSMAPSFAPLAYLGSAGTIALLLVALLSAAALRRLRARKHIDHEDTQKSADTDELTGVANRRVLLTMLDTRIAEARANGTPLALAVFSVDNLKSVNDTHGHAIGDRTIRHVVRTAHHMLRLNDLIGRLDGNEFGVILPKAEQNNASYVCNRLRKRLREKGIPIDGGKQLHPTISSGIASLTDDDDAVSLITRAIGARIIAKREGHDQVRVAL